MNQGNSQFKDLLDVVLGRGIKHSEVIERIHREILEEYKNKYPKGKHDASIVVEETTGKVSVVSSNSIITPPDFQEPAENIVNRVLVNMIKETEKGTQETGDMVHSDYKLEKKFSRPLSKFLFWSYNIFFLSIIVGLILSFIFGSNFRSDVLNSLEEMGEKKLILLFLVFLTPVFSTFSVLWIGKKNLKDGLVDEKFDPKKILLLFELPAILLLAFFCSGVKIISFPIFFFILMIYASLLLVPLRMFNFSLPIVRLAIFPLKQFSLMTSGYLTLLYIFFLPTILGSACLLAFEIFEDFSEEIIFNLFKFIILLIPSLFVLTISAVGIIAPFLITYALFKSFRNSYLEIVTCFGSKKALYLSVSLFIFYFLVLFSVSYQGSTSNFLTRIENLDQLTTFEERESLAKEIESNKREVEDAFRKIEGAEDIYPFAQNDKELENLYRENFNLGGGVNEAIQKVFLILAFPFVYQGSFDEWGKARENFRYLSSSETGKKYVPPIESGRKNVSLISKKVDVKTAYEGLLATVTIEEEYQNKDSFRDEEIIYEFSLPGGSTVKELKLGPNLEFEGLIAPRGAAAKIYEREVSRSKDPALLEQIGIDHYRLRIFPIPRRKSSDRSGEQERQKILFSYVTGLTDKGYSLPAYSKKDNLLSDENTRKEIRIDGETIECSGNDSYVKKTSQSLTDLCNLYALTPLKTKDDSFYAQINPYGTIEELGVKPACDKEKGFGFFQNMNGARIALLYDVSQENKDNEFLENLRKVLSQETSLVQKNTLDLYLFNDKISQKRPIGTEWLNQKPDVVYFGESAPVSALNSIDKQYDFVVLATSSKSFVEGDGKIRFKKQLPVFLVSSENNFLELPGNLVLDILKSGGGVFPDIESVLNHHTLNKKLVVENKQNYAYFGPHWGISLAGPKNQTFFEDNPDKLNYIKTDSTDPLSYLASRELFMKLPEKFEDSGLDTATQNANLDKLNEYAKSTHIVTPFSSLIALVNEKQIKDLKDATKKSDRYSYDSESASGNDSFQMRESSDIDFAVPSAMPMRSSGWQLEVPLGISGDNFKSSSESNLPPLVDYSGHSASGKNMRALTSLLSFSLIPLLVLPILVGIIVSVVSAIIKKIRSRRSGKSDKQK